MLLLLLLLGDEGMPERAESVSGGRGWWWANSEGEGEKVDLMEFRGMKLGHD